MTPDEFDQFRHDAVHALMDLNEDCKKKYGMGTWPRFDYDFDAGTLVFSDAGVPKVVATIQVVGTTSNKSHTWLWAWANASLPLSVTERVHDVRQFGISEGLSRLIEEKLLDEDHLGWDMTAVMVRIIGAKGGYRCPGRNGFIYLALTGIKFADSCSDAPVVAAPLAGGVTCNVHGAGRQTFACEHLVQNPGQEWFSDAPTAANPWPDAWCKICDASYRQQGQWNDENSDRVKIKLLCHLCYESLRAEGR